MPNTITNTRVDFASFLWRHIHVNIYRAQVNTDISIFFLHEHLFFPITLLLKSCDSDRLLNMTVNCYEQKWYAQNKLLNAAHCIVTIYFSFCISANIIHQYQHNCVLVDDTIPKGNLVWFELNKGTNLASFICVNAKQKCVKCICICWYSMIINLSFASNGIKAAKFTVGTQINSKLVVLLSR